MVVKREKKIRNNQHFFSIEIQRGKMLVVEGFTTFYLHTKLLVPISGQKNMYLDLGRYI